VDFTTVGYYGAAGAYCACAGGSDVDLDGERMGSVMYEFNVVVIIIHGYRVFLLYEFMSDVGMFSRVVAGQRVCPNQCTQDVSITFDKIYCKYL
jgi:hypothetical protein